MALSSKSQCGGSATHRGALEQCEGVVPSALLPETLPAALCSALGPQHQRDRDLLEPARLKQAIKACLSVVQTLLELQQVPPNPRHL